MAILLVAGSRLLALLPPAVLLFGEWIALFARLQLLAVAVDDEVLLLLLLGALAAAIVEFP